jgi:hypothetical protein
MDLTHAEKLALSGLGARETLALRQLQDEYRGLLAEMELRLGLSAGAIGKTHLLDLQAGGVVAKPGSEMPNNGTSSVDRPPADPGDYDGVTPEELNGDLSKVSL